MPCCCLKGPRSRRAILKGISYTGNHSRIRAEMRTKFSQRHAKSIFSARAANRIRVFCSKLFADAVTSTRNIRNELALGDRGLSAPIVSDCGNGERIRISLLREPRIPFFDELFELFVLLRNPIRVSLFIRSPREGGGLLNQLADVVPNNRDAILKLRKRKRRKRTVVAHRVSPKLNTPGSSGIRTKVQIRPAERENNGPKFRPIQRTAPSQGCWTRLARPVAILN